MNRRLLTTTFSLVVIVAGTIAVIRFAKGYRPTSTGNVRATGLLAANSFPNGASVYINGDLKTATDTTLNLEPGEYDIEIKKDGYTPWKKKIHIEKELVTQTNAVLFPIAPSLTPLTFTGAANITPSPDGQQLLFTTASAAASKSNGIYVMNLADSPISLQRGPFQIALSSTSVDWSNSTFVWSPDSSQVILKTTGRTYLLVTNKVNNLDTLPDVTARQSTILSEWNDLFEKKFTAALALFPKEIVTIATQSAKNIYVSPDQERLLYTATASAHLSETLLPPVVAANSQTQSRDLIAGNTYVYDRTEDRNFEVIKGKEVVLVSPSPTPKTGIVRRVLPVASQSATLAPVSTFMDTLLAFRNKTSGLFTGSPQWLPDSKHIIAATPTGISISEYDGTNRTPIYAGPFEKQFVYPWPNGSKLIILTNFNQSDSGGINLYALGLK
ncbi:MAG: PEGA domain-containing protein [Candidatus Woesebacteria bacterium]